MTFQPTPERMKSDQLIHSPMNYTGGKFKLLPAILPLFPKRIGTFVDLFCGGLNVAVNADCESVVANDVCTPVVRCYEYLAGHSFEEVRDQISLRIAEFGLSDSDRESYFRLRREYAASRKPLDLFLLSTMCFNNQIRFNAKGEFNMSYGERLYNDSIEENLKAFMDALHRRKYAFLAGDFQNPDIVRDLGENDFVYCDPPYMLSNAAYNVGWQEHDSVRLLEFLDSLDERKIRFALSEVLEHKGMVNEYLKKWSGKYRVELLDMDYGRCSYHRSLKQSATVEVLVCNYGEEAVAAEDDCGQQESLF